MIAPTLASVTLSAFNTNGDKSVSVTVQTGDYLVVKGGGENTSSTFNTPTGGGLTYTLAQSQIVTSRSSAYIWTSSQVASGGTFTVTCVATGFAADHRGIIVEVWRNSSGFGNSSSTNTAGPAAPSVSLTTASANSAISAYIGDWNTINGSSRTWLTINSITPTAGNSGEEDYLQDGASYSHYAATWSDAGTAAAKTVGMSAPSTMQPSIVAVEIKGSVSADSTLSVTATGTATASIVTGADSALAVTVTETATASIVTAADSVLAITVSLTASATTSTPVIANADSSLPVAVSILATATVTHIQPPEFDFSGIPPAEEIPEYLLTTGVPPQEVIDALTSGVIVVKRRVEIYESDAVTPFNIPFWDGRLIDGSITVDGTRDERRMCEFQLDNADFELGLDPYGGFWYDKILKAFWGIEYNNPRGSQTFWEMQVGEFMIDRIDEDYFPNTCKVTGRDYAKKCLITSIGNAIQFSNQTPVETIIGALGANAGIKKFRLPYTGLTFQDDIVFDAGTARWQIMKKLGDSVGFEVYITADGYLTMRAYQDPVLSPLSWTFQPGPTEDGSLVTYSRSSDDALVKNHVTVIGATVTDDLGLSTTAFGEARNDDPSSPTNIDRIGDRVDPFKSDYITDSGQAQAVAEMRLRVSSLEEFNISFSSMILPWVDGNDIVDIINPKETLYIPARFLLSNYTLPFGLGAMTGTGKRVTIVGTLRQFGVH